LIRRLNLLVRTQKLFKNVYLKIKKQKNNKMYKQRPKFLGEGKVRIKNAMMNIS